MPSLLVTYPPLQVNFVPFFLAPPGKATVAVVADHIEHISRVIGKRQLVKSLQFILLFS